MKRLLTICMASLSMVSAYAGGTWESLTVNGASRKMKVYVPDNTPSGAALVIACHGMNQDANWHDSNSKWAAVSDTAKFVLVFPEGIDRGWDIGGNRDVDFVCAIIDKMEKEHNISTGRVYLTGFSMGGMFTYHCANRIPDKIAAFVPVSGYPMWDKGAYSSRPVPIMHVHGTGDDVCVFSGVQLTLDNWIKRNECNTVEELIDPYPAGNRNRGAKMHIWSDGLDGVEVRLLEFKDKGHWQSEDPVFCLTSVEGWNFMKRWSLGPDAPKVTAVEPEDGSFDLPLEGMSISLTFDIGVDAAEAEASLVGDGVNIPLEVSSAGNVVTLSVPEILRGEYMLSLRNVKGENDGIMKNFKATYTFGVEEVGEVPPYNVIFNPDLRAEENTVGEGIPTGWYRINTRSNGKDEKQSGSANTGGARMKYFMKGGDFDEGFYLSARDYDRCEITYGKYTPEYALHFEKGRYVATFNSVYWNKGSLDGNVKFDFTVKSIDGSVVASFPSLPSTGNMDEQQGRIGGSTVHSLEFDIPADGDYTVTYSMTAGWSAVIVGNLKIETAMSPAERYKGGFLRTLRQAKDLYASIPESDQNRPEAIALIDAINSYDSLVSTSPTVYEAATKALKEAMEKAADLSDVDSIVAESEITARECFNIHGQVVNADEKGLVIERIHYRDGKTAIVKKIN
ncbi:MAG: dienelactone hydrolase family protein [Muribaculaceae bacterium]|nr:dienelactone hydrolase family protein [Muribaculaceae bacterium]